MKTNGKHTCHIKRQILSLQHYPVSIKPQSPEVYNKFCVLKQRNKKNDITAKSMLWSSDYTIK